MKGNAQVSAHFTPEKGALSRRAHAREFRRGDSWKKVVLACARVLAACALSALIGVAAVQGYQWATRSTLFAVRAVHVRGNLHVQSSDLIARSGLLAGQNLFRVDLAAAARGVESSPWVISASVSRQLPSSIEIEVREHMAVARVLLGQTYFSDRAGKLFKKVGDDDDTATHALPIISGLARADWEAHRDESTAQLRSGLQLISDWRDAGLNEAELSEVRVESDGAYTVIARQGAQVQEARVGHGPFAANLHRLIRVRLELLRRNAQATHIDLDNPSRPDEVAAQIVRNEEPVVAHPKTQVARGE